MLHLTFAPNASHLIRPVADIVRKLWIDPFYSPLFVVPNHIVGKWLKLRLAEELGGIVDADVKTLENVLWEALRPDPDMELLRKEPLQQVICAFLDEERLKDRRYAPIASYLIVEGAGIDPVKRVQLAGEIARLLLEYEYNRPSVWDWEGGGWRTEGLDRTWLDGRSYFSKRVHDVDLRRRVMENETWQRDVYESLFGTDGVLMRKLSVSPDGRSSRRYLTLPRLYALRHEAGTEKGSILSDERPLILFLLTKISHFHRNMLLEMSLHREIHAFLVNPCSEFWEDVDTMRGRRGRGVWSVPEAGRNPPINIMSGSDYEREELGADYRTPEHRLLELWGASGKESITLWCQASRYDFNFILPEVASTENRSRLRLLQESILIRDDGVLAGPDKGNDPSIRLLAAPEPGREVEALRAGIIDLLSEDRSLTLNDIAVYLPDPHRYLSFINKIFGAYERGEDGYIPFTVLGTDAGQTRFARAVEDLCALCREDFTRGRVYSFLRNDAVRKAVGLCRAEVDIWEKWSVRLGFFRGFDAAHRLEMGDHESVASDAHTFEAGMARLLLGPLADAPIDVGMNLNAAGCCGTAPFTDFDTSDKAMTERYCATIEKLAKDCRSFRKSCTVMTPSEVVEAFCRLVDAWIDVDSAQEAHCRKEFMNALEAVKLQQEAAGRKNIPFDEFIAVVRSSIPDELAGSVAAWSGSVTFAPLRCGNILPHRVIFVLGMDAESFPGCSITTPVNLLTCRRIIGDPDQVRDNRYAFLELICAAMDRLVISYRGADILRDRIVQPSNVVLELASVAGLHIPDVEKGPEDSGVLPLLSHEAAAGDRTRCWDPDVARLSVLAKRQKKLCRYRLPEYKDERKKTVTLNTETLPVKTTVGDIRMFLENPLEYRLYRSLGLRNEKTSETMSTVDEPAQSDFYSLFEIKNRVLKTATGYAFSVNESGYSLSRSLSEKVREVVRSSYAEMCAKGRAPEGMFSKMELDALLQWAEGMTESVFTIAARFSGCKLYLDSDIDFRDEGPPREAEIASEDGYRYRIGMQMPMVLRPSGDSGCPWAIVRLGGARSRRRKTDDLDVWVTLLLYKLNGIEPVTAVTIQQTDGMMYENEWSVPAGYSPQVAKRWLTEVVQEMLELGVCEHTPAVWFEKADNSNEEFGDAAIGRLRVIEEEDGGTDESYSLYRPRIDVFRLTEARLPTSKASIERAFRRLRPILRDAFDA